MKNLFACLLAALVLSLGFAFSVPLTSPNPRYAGLNPDETDHVGYVEKLREARGLVRFPDKEIRAARAGGEAEGPELRAFAEVHQPPLYYALGAVLGGSLTALRLLSALFGLATVALAFRAARDLIPERPEAAWGAAGLLATLPAAAQLSGAASNDALTTLVCTGIIWRLGLLVRDGSSTRDALILAVWLGVGLWTKLTVLQLFPLVALAFALVPKRPWGAGALALTGGLLLAAPWLIRNQLLYGDPLNLAIFPLTAPVTTPTPRSMQAIEPLGLTPVRYILLVIERSFATIFYLLPPNGPLWPKPGPAAFAALVLLAGVVGGIRAAREGSPQTRRVLLLCLCAPLVLLPFFVRFNLSYFQAQGRYFHPALFPMVLGFAVGLSKLAGKTWGPRTLFGVCVVWFLLSGLQILTLCQAL
jgi:4-amino-4-deoxy-L-arabinose transferase-like glycosyltransferase